MDKQQRFEELHPDVFFLTSEQPTQLADFLRQCGWIVADEAVQRIEKPGEGNMNYVLRVGTDRQSFIVKQSRPWVEKYPQLDAPIERIIVEAQFYDALSEVAGLQSYIPALKGFKAQHFMMAVEDLGEASDFTNNYKKSEQITPAELADLIQFISGLHQVSIGQLQVPFPDNQALKTLNAEHIFNYPYLEDNGFDLDTVQPGLQTLATTYKKDETLKKKIQKLGEVYLGEGGTLLHGDYYPGSWLRTAKGTRIIDPEFAYVGCAEFDLGVLVAHLRMAQTDDAVIRAGLEAYDLTTRTFDHALFAGFCGAEILRRIIGLAQLPLDLTLEEKEHLLLWAAASVLNPETNPYLTGLPEKDSVPSIDKKE
ncbi:phosphotransferase [Cytophagaceae bacterium SJW1-29]|uniref:Phosphotransferase n=1 Tax=Salmonirosea aquatica TaxID=2654236 RepID=A0A7C9BB23_9BACT|nr:phosphotransferase [Cytophagaceae bacterium SJW1-29]